MVDGSDVDERVLPKGPKVVEIGANVLSSAEGNWDVVSVTDSACATSSVVMLGWSELSEAPSVWIIVACVELVPSGVPASVVMGFEGPLEVSRWRRLVLFFIAL